jgi:hypothetical protein
VRFFTHTILLSLKDIAWIACIMGRSTFFCGRQISRKWKGVPQEGLAFICKYCGHTRCDLCKEGKAVAVKDGVQTWQWWCVRCCLTMLPDDTWPNIHAVISTVVHTGLTFDTSASHEGVNSEEASRKSIDDKTRWETVDQSDDELPPDG